jgi:hypothetical protein
MKYAHVRQVATFTLTGTKGHEEQIKDQLLAGRFGYTETMPELIQRWAATGYR